VVIADEAHRSQYDFIDGFAGTCAEALPKGRSSVSRGRLSNFPTRTPGRCSAITSASTTSNGLSRTARTVPIYYESRLAKLELKESERPRIDPEFEEVTEGEEVESKEKLKTKWAQLEALVGAENRIRLIAEDLVSHFEDRLEAMDGKAMIVGMSRRICVELYNAITAIRPDWKQDHQNDQDGDQQHHHHHNGECNNNRISIQDRHDGLRSRSGGVAGAYPHQGAPETLAKRFKEPRDPFRIVIVRDMWLTGFDAPCLHTMYVDKPMRSHGLMQAIARVNRVFKDKPGGLVVDYLGLAHELKSALANYTESGVRVGQRSIRTRPMTVMLEKFEICCGLFYGFDWAKWKSRNPQERLSILPAAKSISFATGWQAPFVGGRGRSVEGLCLGRAARKGARHPG